MTDNNYPKPSPDHPWSRALYRDESKIGNATMLCLLESADHSGMYIMPCIESDGAHPPQYSLRHLVLLLGYSHQPNSHADAWMLYWQTPEHPCFSIHNHYNLMMRPCEADEHGMISTFEPLWYMHNDDEIGFTAMDDTSIFISKFAHSISTGCIAGLIMPGQRDPQGLQRPFSFRHRIIELTNAENVDKLRQILKNKGENERLDLSGPYNNSDGSWSPAKSGLIDFSGLDLSECDFSNSILRYVNFSKCTLSGAKLNYANLSNACLREAYLQGADFTGAVLTAATLNLASVCLADTNGNVLGVPLFTIDSSPQLIESLDKGDIRGAGLQTTFTKNGQNWQSLGTPTLTPSINGQRWILEAAASVYTQVQNSKMTALSGYLSYTLELRAGKVFVLGRDFWCTATVFSTEGAPQTQQKAVYLKGSTPPQGITPGAYDITNVGATLLPATLEDGVFCPNGQTVAENKQAGKDVWYWMMAPTPPAPPKCVPNPAINHYCPR